MMKIGLEGKGPGLASEFGRVSASNGPAVDKRMQEVVCVLRRGLSATSYADAEKKTVSPTIARVMLSFSCGMNTSAKLGDNPRVPILKNFCLGLTQR